MLVVPLAVGNAEQHSEVTWPGLIQEACKVPNDHFFQVITNPVSETAFRVLSQAFNYLLKYQLQYQPSDRSLCLPLPSTLQILLLFGMQQHPSYLFVGLFIA